MATKNVIIVGAGGNLGLPVLTELLAASNLKVSVLSRESSTSTFPAGVNVIKADYASKSSLVDAFKGQDVVVSTIMVINPLDQIALIDAAVEAGVARFLPSEYGCNSFNPVAQSVPVFGAKVAAIQHLSKYAAEGKITWSALITGPFFDWGLKVGTLGFDFQNKKATVWTPGTNKFSCTTLSTIGKSVVGIVNHLEETKNRAVYVSEYDVSQSELLSIFENKGKWEVSWVDREAALADGIEKLKRGDFSGVLPCLQGVIFGGEEYGSVFHITDNKLLGIASPKPIAEAVADYA